MFRQLSSPSRDSRSTLSLIVLSCPIGVRSSRSGSPVRCQASWASSRSRRKPAARWSASEVTGATPSAASVVAISSSRAANPSGP